MRNDPNPHWFLALRALTPLMAANLEVLLTGPFAPLLQGRRVIRDTSNNPTDHELAKIVPILDSAPPHIALPCKHALQELRREFSIPYCVARSWLSIKSACFIWAGVVNQPFLELVYDRCPQALIVMAHYCVMLKMVHTCWYLKGLGVTMLAEIEEELDNEWLPWIQWAKEQPTG
jgi:hypothetical protein